MGGRGDARPSRHARFASGVLAIRPRRSGPLGAHLWRAKWALEERLSSGRQGDEKNGRPFALGAPAVTVTSNGTNFACALLADGNIKCWDGSTTGPLSVWLGCEFAVTQQVELLFAAQRSHNDQVADSVPE
jgi:hypothetical protein